MNNVSNTIYTPITPNTTRSNSIATPAHKNILGYTCFDISSACDIPNYINTDQFRLDNIISDICNIGDIGRELLDKVEALCTTTGAKIKFAQPDPKNPSPNPYSFSPILKVFYI